MSPKIYISGDYETTAMSSSEMSNYRSHIQSASHSVTRATRALQAGNDSGMYDDSLYLLGVIKKDLADTLAKTISEHRFATT